jgi:hypothetical protein
LRQYAKPSVIPAKAGIQPLVVRKAEKLDPGLRRDDGIENNERVTKDFP